VVFVAVLLAIAGTLNIIYGIATVGNAHFFANTQHALSSLHIWAWITLIVGIIQLTVRASLSEAGLRPVHRHLRGEHRLARVAASIGATHPWWPLAIFALCMYVPHGRIVFGEDRTATT
jgi:hypothetical protein